METNTTPAPSLRFSWRAPRVSEHERSHKWYLTGAVIVLAGAAYGILSGNWSFALVILLLGAVYYLTRNAPAVMGEITVTDYGFQLNDVFTAWNDCQDFWLIATPDYMELHILRKKGWNREAVIQTGDVDPQLIRQALSELLPERSNMKEKLLDAFIRICKL